MNGSSGFSFDAVHGGDLLWLRRLPRVASSNTAYPDWVQLLHPTYGLVREAPTQAGHAQARRKMMSMARRRAPVPLIAVLERVEVEGKLEALDAALPLDVDVLVRSSARCTQRATILCCSMEKILDLHVVGVRVHRARAGVRNLAIAQVLVSHQCACAHRRLLGHVDSGDAHVPVALLIGLHDLVGAAHSREVEVLVCLASRMGRQY